MFRRSVLRACWAAMIPPIVNEPMEDMAPGSASAVKTAEACKKYRATTTECPIVVNGVRHTTDAVLERRMPSDHSVLLAQSTYATPDLAKKAVDSALAASREWGCMSFNDRASIFLRAAHLVSTKYRYEVRATTMLGQGKTPWQAEIDSVAETCDFLRFSVKFADELLRQQPISPPSAGLWNALEYRPLEGFVSAISPFNFTAIAANLVACPALMGNVVVWKPSPNAILSNYLMFKIFEEAGVPPGVINFLPCEPDVMTSVVNVDPNLAGIAFTGSTKVFTALNKQVAAQLETYRNFPRISGETGGKDFHLIHPTADLKLVASCTTRGAFEYQGQKCSATSRLYAPKSCWNELKKYLLEAHGQLRMGQPDDFSNFMSAVIDRAAFEKNKRYIDIAKNDTSNYTVIVGGGCNDSKGWFIEPTIIQTTDPKAQLLREEIFGPVLTVFVYDDSKPNFWKDACELVDSTTMYGLTGSVFAQDRQAIIEATHNQLRYAAGNFYINDKCTGAVVGQQPFGGARWSGSNDKPGSPVFITRWVSPRTIKEGYEAAPQVSYPHQLPTNICIQ